MRIVEGSFFVRCVWHRFRRSLSSINLVSVAALLLLSACDSQNDAGVQVVQYQGPRITEDYAVPRDLHWVATPDTVLRRVRLEGIDEDLGEVRHRFQFQEDPGHLPLLLSYWHRPDSANRARLVSGTIYIQHFALDGEISGRFEGSLYFPTLGLRVGTAFWADASRENVTPTQTSR